MKTYIRSVKLKSYATKAKSNRINALIKRYKKQVNLFISYIWENREIAKLDGVTLKAVSKVQNLSERYKSIAHYQALSICKNSKTKSKPKFTGYPLLDAKAVTILPNKRAKSYDLWFKLSNLKKMHPIEIPTKKHKQLNKWLAKGSLIQGCELRPDGFIVWIECVIPEPKNGLKIGIDIGMNKLITTNYGGFIGIEFNKLNDKILRKKKNSKAYKRAIIEKNNYIIKSVNELPWDNLELICYENLKNITKGKKGRSKNLRIKQQHWSHRQVIGAVKMKANANRVRLCYVNPAYTSQMCSACGIVAASNRNAESYSCSCGHTEDADINGAKNILKKGLDWLGSFESPNKKDKNLYNSY